MQSTATTVKDYLASLPPDRLKAVTTLRALIRKNLPPGYREVVQYGIGWVVPLSRYPDTYNGQPLALAGIASQKHYISLYLMTVYGYPEIERWFKAEYAKSGKKLKMVKCCLRFRSLDEIPLRDSGPVRRAHLPAPSSLGGQGVGRGLSSGTVSVTAVDTIL